jgi:hypothetical protein
VPRAPASARLGFYGEAPALLLCCLAPCALVVWDFAFRRTGWCLCYAQEIPAPSTWSWSWSGPMPPPKKTGVATVSCLLPAPTRKWKGTTSWDAIWSTGGHGAPTTHGHRHRRGWGALGGGNSHGSPSDARRTASGLRDIKLVFKHRHGPVTRKAVHSPQLKVQWL